MTSKLIKITRALCLMVAGGVAYILATHGHSAEIIIYALAICTYYFLSEERSQGNGKQ